MNDSFEVRMFRWAQAYAIRQLESDFPLVRQFDIPSVRLFLRHMQSLGERQKGLLTRGLLGRFHVYAVEVLREPAEPEQVHLVERWLERGTSAFETGEFGELYPAAGARLTRRELREQTLSALGETLGVQTKYDAPGFLRFAVPLGTASVVTLICIGGRGNDLAYFQEVFSSDGSRIATAISALSLLGITGGPVDWREVGDRNVEAALQALRNGATEFISAAPSILAGAATPAT